MATRVGGIPEQVSDGKTGFLVEPGDAEAMARLAMGIITDPAMRRSPSESALSEARRRFSLADQTEAYLHWYREIMTRSVPPTNASRQL